MPFASGGGMRGGNPGEGGSMVAGRDGRASLARWQHLECRLPRREPSLRSVGITGWPFVGQDILWPVLPRSSLGSADARMNSIELVHA